MTFRETCWLILRLVVVGIVVVIVCTGSGRELTHSTLHIVIHGRPVQTLFKLVHQTVAMTWCDTFNLLLRR